MVAIAMTGRLMIPGTFTVTNNVLKPIPETPVPSKGQVNLHHALAVTSKRLNVHKFQPL
ncbi:MAG: hypothetical protein WA364_24430 [Candidatus Nitrosopolaris sp.]